MKQSVWSVLYNVSIPLPLSSPTTPPQACIDDNFDMVKSLVDLGASVDAVDNEGWTALHAATSCGHEHIVE